MPPEVNATTTPGSTQKTGGVFEFGSAPEAEKDASTQETPDTNTPNAEETSQAQTETQPETTGNETQEQVVDEQGNPVTETAKEPVKETFEINGRTFTSKDELVTAYKNSSSEGIRLAKANEEFQHKMNEMHAQLLEMEEAQTSAPFPGLLSTDKAQEEAQLEMLPQHKQTEYILSKREWEQKQTGLKEANAQSRKQIKESSKHVKELIARNDQDMAGKPAEFPGYKDLKPTMDKIVELTPLLANRPETPYLSFWIAYGLNAFNKENATKTVAAQTVDANKVKVASAQTQIGKGGNGKPVNATASGGSSIAQAWKDRNGSVI